MSEIQYGMKDDGLLSVIHSYNNGNDHREMLET